jgi:hypothetical protein
VALEAGAKLVICVNPIVPVDTLNVPEEVAHNGRLTDLGLPTVLSQTFRTLIHSRMRVGMAAYTGRFPDRDLVLFEPQPDDYRMFFTNIFRFGSRKELCEYAYRATRRDLLRRYDELAPVFARHGVTLRRDVLEDETMDLWRGVGLPVGLGWPAGTHLDLAGTLEGALARLDSWADRRSEARDRQPAIKSRGQRGRRQPRGRRRASRGPARAT